MKENNFKFRESFALAVSAMNNEEAGEFIKGVCEYAFERKKFEPTSPLLYASFALVKKVIDQDVLDREYGKLGARASRRVKAQPPSISVMTEIVKQPSPLDNLLKSIIERLESEEEFGEEDSEESVAE